MVIPLGEEGRRGGGKESSGKLSLCVVGGLRLWRNIFYQLFFSLKREKESSYTSLISFLFAIVEDDRNLFCFHSCVSTVGNMQSRPTHSS